MEEDTFDIDYDNLVVKKVKVKDATVLYFDNFYKNPEKILELYVKNVEKLEVSNTDKYPGSKMNLLELLGHERVREHLNEVQNLLVSNGIDATKFDLKLGQEKLNVPDLFPKAFTLSKLDVNHIKELVSKEHTAQSSHMIRKGTTTNPHTDGSPRKLPHSLFAGVCYLSEHVHGGTGLYYNKLLKTHRIDKLFEIRDAESLWNKISESATEDIQQLGDIVEKHFTERGVKMMPNDSSGSWTNKGDENFELIHIFPMKFNRMVFYEGNLIHAIYIEDENFYKIHDRITANIWIPINWEDVDSKDCSLSDDILEYLDELTLKFSNERDFILL